MSQQPNTTTPQAEGQTSNRFFATMYERSSRGGGHESFMEPLRREVTGLARVRTLEVGAGNGLNFALYSPDTVERVDAIEPDSVMLGYARGRAVAARVPIILTQAPVERLPFADETFESAVATLVFCSVSNPLGGLREIWRTLKPGSPLLMVEHVRAHNALFAAAQTLITPVTRMVAGNCHWNRDTVNTVREAGFTIQQQRELSWSLMPFVVLHAIKARD